MQQTIKNFMMAGMGGSIAYYITSYVLTTLVTGTTTADTFVKALIPIILGIGAVWIILSVAFKAAD